MGYKRREWLRSEAYDLSAIAVSIDEDGYPSLYLTDGRDNVVSMLTLEDTLEGKQANMDVIMKLIEVLSEFHSAYLVALHPESVTAGTPGASIVHEVTCLQDV